MTDGPLAAYRAKLAAGALKPDPAQALAAEKLQSLHHALVDYEPATGLAGWKARFGLTRRRTEPPQGLYLYGGVGRGKSMLMDLFFASAPVDRKRRVHFHAFMQQVHERFGQLRKAANQGDDPIPPLAAMVAKEAWLLCFDEFQVEDIADAMILGRLFENLFEQGVVVVATSNRPPSDLYLGGLQRDRFLPFIGLLERRLDLLGLGDGTDYRLERMRQLNVYLTPHDAAAEGELDDDFLRLTDGIAPQPDQLSVQGRRLEVRAAAGVVRASFAEFCERALGPGDFLAIARHYHTVVLSGIPRMGPERRNEARRFITLIDALYEHRVNLICSAAADPDDLYTAGDGAFAFQRTASRLIEMRSAEYIAEPHVATAT